MIFHLMICMLYFFVAVVEKYYRCIVSRLPKAKTAIFLEGIDGELNFLHIRKDDEQKTTATSPYYTRPRFGDSGASVFRKIIYEGTEAPHGISKHVALGVISLTRHYETNSVICPTKVTKITKSIVQWVKDVDQIYQGMYGTYFYSMFQGHAYNK